MADFLNTIDVLGDEAVADSLIDRTITEFKDNRMTTVGANAFCGCTALTSVELPNATELGDSAFDRCTAMTVFEFPNVLKTRNSVFGNNKEIVSLRLPKATALGKSQVVSYSKLEELYIPMVKTIDNYGFTGCGRLKKEKCDFSSLETVTGSNVFYQSGLGPIIDCFPSLKTVGAQMFADSSVTAADLPMAEKINQLAFSANWNFRTLVLRRTDTVCVLDNISALTSGQFKSGGTGGVLIVPSALVTAYTEATNWSILYGYGTNRFLPLEDYTVDGTTTGAIDWDKVNALF